MNGAASQHFPATHYVNQALRAGYRCANDVAYLTQWQTSAYDRPEGNGSPSNGHSPPAGRLSAEAVDQIRQQLQLGHRVGLKYADPR